VRGKGAKRAINPEKRPRGERYEDLSKLFDEP
jgi:hypothetical protein